MTLALQVGPLLGLESDTLYTVCFLTDKSIKSATVKFADVSVKAVPVNTTPKGQFWRAQIAITADISGKYVSYTISLNDKPAWDRHQHERWTFYVP